MEEIFSQKSQELQHLRADFSNLQLEKDQALAVIPFYPSLLLLLLSLSFLETDIKVQKQTNNKKRQKKQKSRVLNLITRNLRFNSRN